MVWGESIVSFFMTSSNYHFRMSAPKGSFAWKLTNRGWRNITRATDSILSIFDKIAAEYIRCEWVVNNWFWIIDMHCDSCLHRRRRRRHHTNQSHVQFPYLFKNNISDSTYNNWRGGKIDKTRIMDSRTWAFNLDCGKEPHLSLWFVALFFAHKTVLFLHCGQWISNSKSTLQLEVNTNSNKQSCILSRCDEIGSEYNRLIIVSLRNEMIKTNWPLTVRISHNYKWSKMKYKQQLYAYKII